MAEEVYDGAIGIDLGTTYSCVANYEGSGVEIIANEQGSLTTPSFVSFTDEERLIGESAKNQAAMNPVNTVFDVKRLIGRRFDDETVKKDIESWPFKVVDKGGSPMVQVEYLKETKTFSPQEISSMVLMKMKEIAETKLGKKVKKAVITVPAYFNDNQRQATKDAGAIADLQVLRIINEPTAAAIAYGLGSGKSDKEKNVLIYDLGGGTFDVSVLNIQGGVFTVKSTNGDTHLGGQDFDTNLLDHFKKEFQRKTKKDLSGDPRALRRLRTACERAKRTLSGGTQATIEIDSLFDGEDFNSNITRARFEDLNQKAFAGTMIPVQKVLDDADLDKSKIDDIVLVGGSTRIPRIQKLLSDFFDGKKLEKSINPDEAVAYGAAVQAGILSGKATSAETADLLLLDVVPLSLGVAMEGNIFAPVVPRGQTVPTIKKRTFTTVADNQQTVQFPVFQGERVNCEDNTSLGEFTLAPIPPMKAGDAVLEVVFEVDVNGILKVTATEKTSGRSANITISNSVGKLSSGEIESMINDAQKFKNSDDAFSKRFEARQQLESYIARVEEITSDPTMSLKMKRGTKEKIESALSDAMAQLEVEDSPSEELKKKELALKRLYLRSYIRIRQLLSLPWNSQEPAHSTPHMSNALLPPLTRSFICQYSPRLKAISLCSQCRSALSPSTFSLQSVTTVRSQQQQQQRHPFITTPPHLSRQGGKKASKNTVSVNADKTSSLDYANPSDFSALEANIETIVAGLRDNVKRIKPGGVDVEAVGDVRVTLKKPGGSSSSSSSSSSDKGGKGARDVVKVGELAQVVPRGRVLVLLVGEKEHVRPLTTALAASPLALNAQPPSTHAPLELHIPIPPTTTESRHAALSAVSAKGEAALFALREARGAQKKRLRQLKLAAKVGPDSMRRAEKELEKVNERGVAEVKKVVEAGRKAL
ncbi:MAG: hypothetical protein Q9206_004739, partial [Seirophora lacunosa]